MNFPPRMDPPLSAPTTAAPATVTPTTTATAPAPTTIAPAPATIPHLPANMSTMASTIIRPTTLTAASSHHQPAFPSVAPVKRPFRVDIESLSAGARRVSPVTTVGGNVKPIVRPSAPPVVVRSVAPPIMPIVPVPRPSMTQQKTLNVQSPGGTNRAYTFQMGLGSLTHQRQSPMSATMGAGTPSPLAAQRGKLSAGAAPPVVLQRHQIQLPSAAASTIVAPPPGVRYVANAPAGLPLRSNQTTQPIGMARHHSMPVSGLPTVSRMPMPLPAQLVGAMPVIGSRDRSTAVAHVERTIASPPTNAGGGGGTLQAGNGQTGGNGGSTGQSPRPSILRKRPNATPTHPPNDGASSALPTAASRKLVYTAPAGHAESPTDGTTKKLPSGDDESNHSQGSGTNSGSTSDPTAVLAQRPQSTLTAATHPPPTPEPPRANSVNDALNINDLLSPRKRMRKQQFNPEDQNAGGLYITTPVVPPPDPITTIMSTLPTVAAAVVKPPPILVAKSEPPPPVDDEDDTMSDDTQSTESLTTNAKTSKSASKVKRAVSPTVNFGRPLNFVVPERPKSTPATNDVKKEVDVDVDGVTDSKVEYRLRPRLLADYEPTWNARRSHLATGDAAAIDDGTASTTGVGHRGAISVLARIANDKRTWQKFDDSNIECLKRQMQVVGEREEANIEMLNDFLTDFIDQEMTDEDAALSIRSLSTNQRDTFRELIACNVQRHRALRSDVTTAVDDVASIVEKHHERVQRKLGKYANKRKQLVDEELLEKVTP